MLELKVAIENLNPFERHQHVQSWTKKRWNKASQSTSISLQLGGDYASSGHQMIQLKSSDY